MKNRTLIILLLLVFVAVVAYFLTRTQTLEGGVDVQTRVSVQDEVVQVDGGEVQTMVMIKGIVYQKKASLKDVSGESATGTAKTGYADGKFSLFATFDDLPEPLNGDYYEGWVVRQGENESVISTGRAEMADDGTYTNIFSAPEDLTDHNLYVLTLEQDDGNEAPAGHVLEGTLNSIQ